MDYKILEEYAKQNIKDGLIGLATFNKEVAFFDFGCVVVQKDYLENSNVRIVSGGQYFNSDFVGKGMLTAFIQGDHKMAPPSKVILRTLRELSYNHTKGILILVPGSRGNMFNFGLATEKAKNDHIRVELIQLSDITVESAKASSSNSLTGICLLAKIAGAMSEIGKSLSEIYRLCNKLAGNIISVGINSSLQDRSLDCRLCKRNLCMGTDHKAHVNESVVLEAVESIVNFVSDEAFVPGGVKMNLKPQDSVVVLISNNGSLKKGSEFKAIKELIQFFTIGLVNIKNIYTGNFSNDFDVTVSIMKVKSNNVLEYLAAPSSCSGWHTVNQNSDDNVILEQPIAGQLTRQERLSPPVRGPKLPEKAANTLLFATQFACDALISCEKQLNTIDGERGNGDTGTKLRLVSEVLLKRMKKNKIITNYPFTFFESFSKILETAIGGTTGCIYSILFEAAASSFEQYSEDAEITPWMWLQAFEVAADALRKYGNVKFGDNTLYDPICACLEKVRLEMEDDKNFIEAFGKGVDVAECTASMTKRKSKYPDSGAHAVGIWMRAIFEALKLTYPVTD